MEIHHCPLMDRDCWNGCDPRYISHYNGANNPPEREWAGMECKLSFDVEKIVSHIEHGARMSREEAVGLSEPFVQNLLDSHLRQHDAIDQEMEEESKEQE